MKIGVVAPFGTIPLGSGGTSLQCLEFCKAFTERGHKIVLLLPSTSAHLESDHKLFYHIYLLRFLNITGMRQLSLSIYSLIYFLIHNIFNSVDLVVLYDVNFGLLPYIALPKVPIVLRVPDVDFKLSGPGINLLEKIRRSLLIAYYLLIRKKISLFVFPSHFSAKTFIKFFKIVCRPCVVIPNFIPEIFTSISAEPFSRVNVNLVYVGSLTIRKGVHLLVDAYQRLLKERKDLRLILIGGGPLNKSINSIFAKSKRFVELCGNLMLNDVANVMSGCDVFVLPSYIEGQSNSLLQALSIKLAVVASNIEANQEVIINGLNGVFFESGNADDLYNKLKDLLNHPHFAKEMAKMGHQLIISNFNRERTYNLWLKEISEIDHACYP